MVGGRGRRVSDPRVGQDRGRRCSDPRIRQGVVGGRRSVDARVSDPRSGKT